MRGPRPAEPALGLPAKSHRIPSFTVGPRLGWSVAQARRWNATNRAPAAKEGSQPTYRPGWHRRGMCPVEEHAISSGLTGEESPHTLLYSRGTVGSECGSSAEVECNHPCPDCKGGFALGPPRWLMAAKDVPGHDLPSQLWANRRRVTAYPPSQSGHGWVGEWFKRGGGMQPSNTAESPLMARSAGFGSYQEMAGSGPGQATAGSPRCGRMPRAVAGVTTGPLARAPARSRWARRRKSRTSSSPS